MTRRTCWDCAHDVVMLGEHACKLLGQPPMTDAFYERVCSWLDRDCSGAADVSMPIAWPAPGSCPCWAPKAWANLGGEA